MQRARGWAVRREIAASKEASKCGRPAVVVVLSYTICCRFAPKLTFGSRGVYYTMTPNTTGGGGGQRRRTRQQGSSSGEETRRDETAAGNPGMANAAVAELG